MKINKKDLIGKIVKRKFNEQGLYLITASYDDGCIIGDMYFKYEEMIEMFEMV